MSERLTVQQWREQQEAAAPKKKHKYKAKKALVDGIQFDSRREARRYLQLRLLEQAGDITGLELQPEYGLHALGGAQIAKYIGDFRYVDVATGQTVLEDAKGVRTRLYRLKAKWVRLQYGIEIREV